MAAHKETTERPGGRIALCCKSGMQWTVEPNGIRLFDPENDEMQVLTYPEAAVWDLMQRGYSIEKTAELLGAITLEDEKTTRMILMKTFEDWTSKGILRAEVDHG